MPPTPQHYSVLLDTLKTYFPSPVSNPILDGYFVHTVSGFLDRIDALKSAAPVLGPQREPDYATYCDRVLPEEMASVETITALLADYCRGMTVWVLGDNYTLDIIGNNGGIYFYFVRFMYLIFINK